ncbi:fumarylacetoacetate hydrolase family protein [soil metagenome]
MKLASFTSGGRPGFGLVRGDEVFDVSGLDDGPHDLRSMLALESDGWAWLARVAPKARALSLDSVRLLAPIPAPSKFLGLGGNYASHLAEARKINLVRAPGQAWFNKQVSCVAGPHDPVHLPAISGEFDYEGELGVVIGRRCRHVRREDAMDMVAGYVVVNDLSVRDWQMRAPTHTLGKSFDTHGPFGPWMVTRDELSDPHRLRLRTWVNGELRQDGNTAEMTYRIEDMLVELTTAFTLEPGDVLTTGSPAGVGGLMDPPTYLRLGDLVRVEIEGIGAIENRVIAEPNL